MELIKREMPAEYEIIDTGDWHGLVANTNVKGIAEMVEYIYTHKNVFMFLKGDLIDAIITQDKRFSLLSFPEQRVTTPQQQADWVLEILRPIADRILMVMMGNHELKLYPVFDFVQYWADNLGVPWGGYNCKFIHMHHGRPKWKAFLTHGNGSIKSQAKDPIQALANQRALLKKKLQGLCSDAIYMSMGHTHNMLLVNPTIQNQLHLIDDGDDIIQTYRVDTDQSATNIDPEARWYGCSGSFLKTMSKPGEKLIGYGEVAMYQPTEHGYLKLKIEDHKLVWVTKVVV